MMKDLFRSKENEFNKKVLNIIENEVDLAGNKAYDISKQEKFNVTIIPDKNVKAAMFLPISENQYKAHPNTIQAMKKDIFVTSQTYIDHEILIKCKSCSSEIDLQYWNACPFCLKDIN